MTAIHGMDASTRNGIGCAKVKVSSNHLTERDVIMKITTIGIDLAKSVFQVHGVDSSGKAILKKQLKRNQTTAFFAALSPCYWQGSLRQRSSLGTQTHGLWPYRALDGATVRQALRQIQQK